MKQATISSLKGVIVIEDLLRHKARLDMEGEGDSEDILSSIQYLKTKKPCKEVLSRTGIDITLKNLASHQNAQIVKEAENLCDLWELYGKEKSQPTLEVRYDNITKHIRTTSLRYFTKELGDSEEAEKIANVLEKELFHKSKRLISKSYRKTSRKIIFALRHNVKERESLKNGKILPLDFVIRYQK